MNCAVLEESGSKAGKHKSVSKLYKTFFLTALLIFCLADCRPWMWPYQKQGFMLPPLVGKGKSSLDAGPDKRSPFSGVDCAVA